ncbi:hypothetical protein [Hymenobacter tibetensis]|nr:hypothetical protein [Hymenobacter tibetensis]
MFTVREACSLPNMIQGGMTAPFRAVGRTRMSPMSKLLGWPRA